MWMFPIPHAQQREMAPGGCGWGRCRAIKPPLTTPLRKYAETIRFRGGPISQPLPVEAVADFQRRQRPRYALSNNSLISNPLPPSRTQSLQPDFPQPSEMREISADEHEPDSSWRCSENCSCSRNTTTKSTSTGEPTLLLLPLAPPLPPLF